MSLKVGTEEICEIFYGEGEICQGFQGIVSFFGCEEPPTVGNMVRQYSGGVYQFVVSDFTNNFTDPNGDGYQKTKITQLPDVGVLKYNGTAIQSGFEFDLANVGLLTFELESGYTVTDGGYCIEGDQCYGKSRVQIGFQTSDNSEGELYSNSALFAFVLSSGNTPPEVSDNSAQLNSTEYVFDSTSFTKDFQDAEGDSYNNVRIKHLPLIGELMYLTNPAAVGETFQVADSVNLKFVLPDTYAAYDGMLYKFTEELDIIIADQEADGFYLIENKKGILTFTNSEGQERTVEGTVVNEDISIAFSTSDDNPNVEMESEKAYFTLIPTGNINVKDLHTNEPPTVGDNEFTI